MTAMNPFARRFIVFSGLVLITGTALAQGTVCPPDCTISIGMPGDISRPPTINHPVLHADPGARIEFEAPGPAQIIFVNPGKTPFVDRTGQPVVWFNVNRLNGQSLWIRKDSNPCAALPDDPDRSECKYMILDRANFERPPLDPYIIVQ